MRGSVLGLLGIGSRGSAQVDDQSVEDEEVDVEAEDVSYAEDEPADAADAARPAAQAPVAQAVPVREDDNKVTVFGENASMGGEFLSEHDVEVLGKFDGVLVCRNLRVAETAVIKGSIDAKAVVIAGTFVGTVSGKSVLLKKTSLVDAEIRADRFGVEPGARGRFRVNPDKEIAELAELGEAAAQSQRQPRRERPAPAPQAAPAAEAREAAPKANAA